MSNIQQLKTKNKKIHKLKPNKQHIPYQIPIINFSDYVIDSSCLNYGLRRSFIDKNRFVKRDLGVIGRKIFVSPEVKENFTRFLKTLHITNNVNHTKDDTVKPNHSGITKIISRDEDSSKVVINKVDYDKKVEEMINEGIGRGKYEETEDNILKD